MKLLRQILVLFAAACLVFVQTGCSTKRNTFFSRNYHNLTAYYNIYWNGTQSKLEADELLKEKSVDNYFNVLPVFKSGSVSDTAMISKQTNRMIEKGLKAIKKHSISIRGKEYVKTIDNAYLLMGQGFFYQQQYSKSRAVFNFVLSEFASNPERYEAMLWIARTYIREDDYSMATSFISQVEAQDQKVLMKETFRTLPQVQAEYLLAQEKYREAVPYLQTAIQRCNDRDQKARLYFILGQIEQNAENLTQAYEYFKHCLKLNPPLDLVFNARLNMALCSDGAGVNSRDVMKGLARMLKDPKNEAYFGRIYYVMGEMAFRQGNDEEAVRNMELSIAASHDDPSRTLLAAKRLSSYFYDNKKYIESQKYYEIAAKVVEYDDPDYYDIVSRAENLADLTVYYKRLLEADTLKHAGKMNKRDQRRYAEARARDYRQQQDAAAQQKKEGAGLDAATPGRSSWYFYNEQTKNAGLAEFNKKWGRRELEDLWFLSSKPAMAVLRSTTNIQDREDDEQLAEAVKILTPADPEYYLNQLPASDSAYQKLDSLIEPSLYYIGMIYCDRLGENEEGEPYLVRLVKEYPASNFIPSTCELLCKIYRQAGNMAAFRTYADILARDYTNTEQNERVNNPNYYRDLQANAERVKASYEKTYEAFVRNDYATVLTNAEEVEKSYPINAFREQFLFLKMIAVAHVSGYKDMLSLSKIFLTSYPESELAPKVKAAEIRAKEDISNRIYSPSSDAIVEEEDAYVSLMRFSNEQIGKDFEDADETPVAEEEQKKEYAEAKESEKHHIILICLFRERDPEVMKLRVEGFNDKFYANNRLEINLSLVEADPDRYMLMVSSFKNLRQALNYKKMILNNDYVFGNIETKNVLEIGDANFEILKETQRPKFYEEFYHKTYDKK